MKSYIFIIGCKYDQETDCPGLEQAYSSEEYAWIALDIMHKNYDRNGIADYKFSNQIICNQQQWDRLPNKCWYIRVIELFKG